jgi:mannose/fructose-specific phosphotransferase system component IIA
MIEGLVVGHRDIGESLIKVVESISGKAERLSFLSNDGLATKELADQIMAFTNKKTNQGLIIFVDVFGGSCWRAAHMSIKGNVRILTGFNLPMLLSFVNKRDTLSFEELPEILKTDGERGIAIE